MELLSMLLFIFALLWKGSSNLEFERNAQEGCQNLEETLSGRLSKSGRNTISMTPSNKITTTAKVQPLVSLNPYQAIWKTKVLLTGKGSMRTYKNARGEGCVFNVELTDEDGTQIQATMFNEAARKFFDKLEIGKVYYISKGTIKVANKQFRTVDNDFEMTLNQYSEVEEAINESMFVPERNFNFVSIDQLGPHVNQKELVDVIRVVQHVSPTTSIRRKRDQQTIPKRDITIVDETYSLSAKFTDVSGEAWFSIFNEEAETLLGCSPNELAKMKEEEEGTKFQLQLKKANWMPFLFRVDVLQTKYNSVKQQQINVIGITLSILKPKQDFFYKTYL